AFSELLFILMRHKGIHIQDGFPCFLTTAHTQADIDAIATAFEESVAALVDAGFIPSEKVDTKEELSSIPPIPHAKLGIDADGNPAWFIEDSKNPGGYLKVNT